MSRKDEILDEIISTEKQLAVDKLEWKAKTAEHKGLTGKKDTLEKAYEELKKKLDEVSRLYHEVSQDIKTLDRKNKDSIQHIDDLKRELSRIIDSERVNQALLAQRDALRNACLMAVWRAENRSDGLGAKTHQIEGGIHLAVTQKAILGDKRGLGKSLTSLIFLDLKDAQKIIAICPSDTMHNFQREVMLWTPHRTPVVLGKLPRGERNFLLSALKTAAQFVLIVNYEAWRKNPSLLQDLKDLQADTILIDESHNIMNANTIASEGVTELVFANNYCSACGSCREANSNGNWFKCVCGNEGNKWEFSTVKNVVPISGTAIMNKPQELFPQIHLVDPENFPDKNLFLRDFCQKNYQGRWTWKFGGEKRLVKMIGPRLLIRNRNDAGIELPPPKPVEHLITREEFKGNYYDQWKAYEQCRQYAQIVLDPEKKIAMSMPIKLTVFMRLRQVLVWPAAIELRVPNSEGLDEFVARLEVYRSVKIDRAEALIRELIEEGDRVVLFSQFKSGLAELKLRLGSRAVVYDGSTSEAARNQIQLDFDVKTVPENPRWDVVLANYKSGGTGLNFNAANQAVLLDSAWNPGSEDQAEGRLDRIGQTKQTFTHYIRVESSVDTWMAQLLEEKRNIIAGFEDESDVYQKAYDALMRGEI
jgi:SNF2 family DNA or RNA helicase